MKKALSLVLAFMLLLSCAACGSKTETPASKSPESSAPADTETEAPVTETEEPGDVDLTGELRITVQSWMLNRYDFEAMKAEFEAAHPGVTVVYNKVDNADVTTNMLQWSQGKTDCDIAIGGSREHAVQYAAKDYIIEFEDEFFTGEFAKDKFFDAFLDLGNVEGTQYMIPFTGEVMFIVCNTELMGNADLVNDDGTIDAPATWEELYDYAKAATVTEGGKLVKTGLSIDWGTNFMCYSYLSALQGMRGDIYEADGTTMDFTSEESAALLTMWQKLVADGYSPTDTFADMDAGRTNFKANNVAMLMTAASRWIECQENLGGADTTTLIPIPGTSENGTLAYIHGAVIPKVSPQVELAKLFIKEQLLNENVHKTALNLNGKMSPILAHYEGLDNPDWPMVIAATESGITNPLYKDFSKLDTAMQVELQKCIMGSQSVEATQKNLGELMKTLDLTTGLK